jgi:6-pyruvoyltetrahydropterin/6-carboxytetrahydropterin synthase
VRSDFRVSVSKDYLVFSSAHFITFRGHQCETLHGHNYRVGVTAEGSVDDEIDHKVLLPLKNPKLAFRDEGTQRHVHYFGEPTYVFPAVDCAMVPIENTTAEMLAQYFAHRVQAELVAMGIRNLSAIEMEVEESFGQSATYRMAMGD